MLIHVDALGSRPLGQARHGHDLACVDDYEAGTGRDPGAGDREVEAARAP